MFLEIPQPPQVGYRAGYSMEESPQLFAFDLFQFYSKRVITPLCREDSFLQTSGNKYPNVLMGQVREAQGAQPLTFTVAVLLC